MSLLDPHIPNHRENDAAIAIKENLDITPEQALREQGFTPIEVKAIVKKKSWENIIEQVLPDEMLAEKHREGLEATTITKGSEGEDIERPDYNVRHKYLQTAYQLRGRLKTEINANMNFTSKKVIELISALDEDDETKVKEIENK